MLWKSAFESVSGWPMPCGAWSKGITGTPVSSVGLRYPVPSAPLSYCTEPGCSVKVPRGKCPQHAKDRRRFSKGQTHYGLVRWRRLREEVLQAHPFCVIKGPRCTLVSDTVDHKIPHRGDERLMYQRSNLQACCASCHSSKTATETWHAT
jgi:5-methylcytosine-specific restriction protein A